MAIHAQGQRFEAFAEYPGVERRQRSARDAVKQIHFPNQVFAAHHYPTEHAPLSIHILGSGVDHDIGPKTNRLLKVRCRKAIIHHQQEVVLTGQGTDQFQIQHFNGRISRGFEVNQPRRRGDERLNFCGIIGTEIAVRNLYLREIFGKYRMRCPNTDEQEMT